MTLLFLKWDFLLGFYIKDKKHSTVTGIFNQLYRKLKTSLFMELLPVILTDNGPEFSDIDGI